jgi:hypothetical protein
VEGRCMDWMPARVSNPKLEIRITETPNDKNVVTRLRSSVPFETLEFVILDLFRISSFGF